MKLFIPIGNNSDEIREYYNNYIFNKNLSNGIVFLDFNFIKEKHPYWDPSKIDADFYKKLKSLIKQDTNTYILMPNLDNDEVELFIDMLESHTPQNSRRDCVLIKMKDCSDFDFMSTEHYCGIRNINYFRI